MTKKRPLPGPASWLVPWYKNERRGPVTSAQLVRFFAVVVTLGILALCVCGYYVYDLVRTNSHAIQQVEDLRQNGRADRLAAQHRQDMQIARLACVVVKYNPKAKQDAERGLSPAQKKLFADCAALLSRPSGRASSSPRSGGPSPSSPSASRAPTTQVEGAQPAPRRSTATSTSIPRRTPAPSRSTARPPAPKPSATASTTAGLLQGIESTVNDTLCGLLKICPPGK